MEVAGAFLNSTGVLEPQSWMHILSRDTNEHARSDDDIHGAMYGFSVVSLVLTTVTTCMRIFTKFHYFGIRRWDDYLMIASWCGLACMWAFILNSVQYGAGDHIGDMSSSDVPGFLKYAYLHELFYALVQCMLKTSIALQIMHIFVPNIRSKSNRNTKFWTIVIFTVLQDMWFMAFFWVSLFQCDPVRKTFNPSVPGTCIGGWDEYNITVSVWNMISDILMLIFPLICISKLRMHISFKIDAAGVFFVGGFAVASSLLRLIFSIRRLYTNDTTLVVTQIALCDTGEITAGILVGNFVPLPRFMFEMKQKIKSMINGSVRERKDPGSTVTAMSNANLPGGSNNDGGPDTHISTTSSQILSFEELLSASRVPPRNP